MDLDFNANVYFYLISVTMFKDDGVLILWSGKEKNLVNNAYLLPTNNNVICSYTKLMKKYNINFILMY